MSECITKKRKRTIPARLYGNPVRILEYALTAPIEQVDELADAMIATGYVHFIIEFAEKVKGAPIDKLADVTIALGDFIDMFDFMLKVKDAPIEKLLLASFKSTEIEKFCRIIGGNHQYIKEKYISFIKIYNSLIKTKLWLELDSFKFLEPSLKEYIDAISYPNVTKTFDLNLELDSFYGNGEKYIYKGTYPYDITTKNNLIDNILTDLDAKLIKFKRISKIATKSIRKPKINATQEQPKRYVRTKR